MTVVDYFTGKVWARALPNRQNNAAQPTLANAINDICVNEAHTIPHIIQVDNEFAVGSFRTWWLQQSQCSYNCNLSLYSQQ